jgi:hypothetical protein
VEYSPFDMREISLHDGVGNSWLKTVDDGDNDLRSSGGQAVDISVALLVFLSNESRHGRTH